MTENDKLQMFEDQTIRTAWDEEKEEWYFSVVDVVVALTESPDYKTGRKYWNKLKQRLKEEGNELVTNCHQLKMKAADGKRRLTDVANTEQLLRIIQSIPSKKAEPFKMWLAMVGRERIEEIIDRSLPLNVRWTPTHRKLPAGVDQPAPANHPRPQGVDRCVERTRGCKRGRSTPFDG